MPRIFILLFFNLIITSASSQNILNQLQGDWIKYKIEMKDGSKLYDRLDNDSSYIQFSFRGSTVSMITNPVFTLVPDEANFAVIENVIQINENASYLIEKISKDSLIIVENIKGPADKLKRYFLLNEKQFKKNINQDKYVANRYNKPNLIENIIIEDLSNAAFRLKGKLVVNLVEKQIEVIIDSSENYTTRLKNKLTEKLVNSYMSWNFTEFNQFKTLEIPFYVVGERINKNNSRAYIQTIDFVVPHYYYHSNSSPTYLNDIKISNDLYKDALVEFNKNDFDKAVELFTKAFQTDKYNLEALYSRAAIYYHIGKKAEACNDWQFLENLGQVRAKNELIKYCK